MEYLFVVLLLMGSAFFSGTEIAYTSLSKLKIKKYRENPRGLRRLVLFIYDHFDNALSTLLIGNNLVNIGATSIATVLAVKLADSMGGKIADDTASTIVTVVMTVLILIVGEITPKMAVAIGQSQAKKILIPVNRCQHFVVGCEELPLGEYISGLPTNTRLGSRITVM